MAAQFGWISDGFLVNAKSAQRDRPIERHLFTEHLQISLCEDSVYFLWRNLHGKMTIKLITNFIMTRLPFLHRKKADWPIFNKSFGIRWCLSYKPELSGISPFLHGCLMIHIVYGTGGIHFSYRFDSTEVMTSQKAFFFFALQYFPLQPKFGENRFMGSRDMVVWAKMNT